MNRTLIAFALLSLIPVGAKAQLKSGFTLRGGYFKGTSYRNGGTSYHLEGPQFGLDIPVLTLPTGLAEIRLSPSVVLGGMNRRGNDADGTLLRIMATAKVRPPLVGVYGIGGLGFGFATERGTTSFPVSSGFLVQIGAGYDLGGGLPTGVKPFVELSYFLGDGPFRGISFEAGIRF